MIIKKVTIRDFGVYGAANEFDFQTNSDQTVVLCGGKNGAGKTTLFESVMLCFYGKDFDDSLRQKEYREKILRSFHKNARSKTGSESASRKSLQTCGCLTLEETNGHKVRYPKKRAVKYSVRVPERLWQ